MEQPEGKSVTGLGRASLTSTDPSKVPAIHEKMKNVSALLNFWKRQIQPTLIIA